MPKIGHFRCIAQLLRKICGQPYTKPSNDAPYTGYTGKSCPCEICFNVSFGLYLRINQYKEGAKVPSFVSYTLAKHQCLPESENTPTRKAVPIRWQLTMKDQETIRTFIESHLDGSPFFVVDVLVGGSKRTPKVTAMLDGDAGIPIDACAEISRATDDHIESLGLFPNGYLLEVSSPGVDQPLKFARQYPKHSGRQLVVHLRDGSVKTGKLTSADGHAIEMNEETSVSGKKKKETVPVTIELADIEKAFVLVSLK